MPIVLVLVTLVSLRREVVLAQLETGSVRVLVADGLDAVVPGVRIQIAGSLNRETVTDSEGVAVLDRLPVGTYQLTAFAHGFREERVSLDVRQDSTTSRRVVLRLSPGFERHITSGCNFVDLPETLQGSSRRADAIAHIHVQEQRVESRIAPGTTQTEINTRSTVEIITVFKRHSRWPTQGPADILQLGGDVDLGTSIERVRYSCHTPLIAGREYVLFLERSKWLGGWGILFGNNGAFLTNGQQLESSGGGEFARRWQSRPAGDLFAALAKLRR